MTKKTVTVTVDVDDKPKKTKKVDNPKILAHLVIDMSGSMWSVQNNTIEAVNEYVDGLSDKARVSVTFFENGRLYKTRKLISKKSWKPITGEEYQPNGSTNLYDAIGETVSDIGDVKMRKDEAVALTIFTDGYENSSREYTQASIKSLLEEKQNKDDWLVTYLGADQDAIKEGGKLGVALDMSVTINKAGQKNVMRGLASKSNMYASGSLSVGAQSAREAVAYTDAERSSVTKADTA